MFRPNLWSFRMYEFVWKIFSLYNFVCGSSHFFLLPDSGYTYESKTVPSFFYISVLIACQNLSKRKAMRIASNLPTRREF